MSKLSAYEAEQAYRHTYETGNASTEGLINRALEGFRDPEALEQEKAIEQQALIDRIRDGKE